MSFRLQNKGGLVPYELYAHLMPPIRAVFSQIAECGPLSARAVYQRLKKILGVDLNLIDVYRHRSMTLETAERYERKGGGQEQHKRNMTVITFDVGNDIRLRCIFESFRPSILGNLYCMRFVDKDDNTVMFKENFPSGFFVQSGTWTTILHASYRNGNNMVRYYPSYISQYSDVSEEVTYDRTPNEKKLVEDLFNSGYHMEKDPDVKDFLWSMMAGN